MNKLYELCLDIIASSFERFYQAYSMPDNDELQRELLFLQREYADEFASRVNNKKKYADFVFNKYLTSAHVFWFEKFSLEAILQIFEKLGPNLEEVHFNDHYRTDVQWENVICHLPNVKILSFVEECSDNVLECIANNCPKLEKLDVGFCAGFTSDGMRYLYQKRKGKKRTITGNEKELDQKEKNNVPCPLLKEINLFGTVVGDECVEQLLKNLPYLEKIDYHNILHVLRKLHLECLDSSPVKRYNFSDLPLIDCESFAHTKYYNEILEACIELCPNLKSLSCPILTLEHLNLCSRLCEMEDLHLNCLRDANIDISDFLKEKGAKLITMYLKNFIFSLFSLGHSCLHLKELILEEVTIRCNENDFIPRLENLEKFDVRNIDLSVSDNCKAICHILTSSPGLKKLHFEMDTPLTSEMKAGILKCCHQNALESIRFSGSGEAEFLKDVLLTCSTLKVLDLTGCDDLEGFTDLCSVAKSIPNKPLILTLGPTVIALF